MRKFGLTVSQALDQVKSRRSIVCPNTGFMRHLHNLQLQLRSRPDPGSPLNIAPKDSTIRGEADEVRRFLDRSELREPRKTLQKTMPKDASEKDLKGMSLAREGFSRTTEQNRGFKIRKSYEKKRPPLEKKQEQKYGLKIVTYNSRWN